MVSEEQENILWLPLNYRVTSISVRDRVVVLRHSVNSSLDIRSFAKSELQTVKPQRFPAEERRTLPPPSSYVDKSAGSQYHAGYCIHTRGLSL